MKHFHFSSLSSTMDMAEVLYKKRTALPFVVSADEQTHGRGRHGRTWHSEKGNIHVTYVLPIPSYLSLSTLPFIFSLCVLETLCTFIPTSNLPILSLKWPNDILLKSKKVAGILIHLLDSSDTHHIISLGIGINISAHPFLEQNTSFPPTSFHKEGYPLSQKNVEHALSQSIQSLLSYLPEEKNVGDFWEKIRTNWLKSCHHKKSMITMRDTHPPHNLLTGRFITIDAHGHLILEIQDPIQNSFQRKSFATGDVFF